MPFKRSIESHLEKWKSSPFRKPLILRGARQVGKTTLVKEFGKTYRYFVSLNLEKEADLAYFSRFSSVVTLAESLLLANNIPWKAKGQTLLFIDEIQESPKAIQALRFFYEEIPELHVIVAGSLLEFAMRKVKSFPVGRVEYLYLHPLNFLEFLKATGKKEAIKQMGRIPVSSAAYRPLLDLFNRYALIGGMPEVISRYIYSGNIVDLTQVYESIWGTYQDDVEKYADNESERKVIKHIIQTAHYYLDKRIKYQNFGNSSYKSRKVSEAFHLLDKAKLIQIIHPSTSLSPPLIPSLRKSPRLQFVDTGLINYILKLQSDILGVEDLTDMYRGSLIPHLITQELISLNTISYQKPNFWVREKNQSSAEVDLLIPFKNRLIPLEVKSGSSGKLKSLHQFMEKSTHKYAVRMYAGEFRIEKTKTPGGVPFYLMSLPYFLGTKLHDYVSYFMENYE